MYFRWKNAFAECRRVNFASVLYVYFTPFCNHHFAFFITRNHSQPSTTCTVIISLIINNHINSENYDNNYYETNLHHIINDVKRFIKCVDSKLFLYQITFILWASFFHIFVAKWKIAILFGSAISENTKFFTNKLIYFIKLCRPCWIFQFYIQFYFKILIIDL